MLLTGCCDGAVPFVKWMSHSIHPVFMTAANLPEAHRHLPENIILAAIVRYYNKSLDLKICILKVPDHDVVLPILFSDSWAGVSKAFQPLLQNHCATTNQIVSERLLQSMYTQSVRIIEYNARIYRTSPGVSMGDDAAPLKALLLNFLGILLSVLSQQTYI